MVNRLKWMEEALVDVIEMQFCNLDTVCTKELGEAVDIIKDLEEAIYYHTITKAMQEEKKNTSSTWKEEGMSETIVKEEWDQWLGTSPHSRKKYMEAKDSGKDKAVQLRELEKYAQELHNDIMNMIADTSLEEKTYMEKKITALASKIGQMK